MSCKNINHHPSHVKTDAVHKKIYSCQNFEKEQALLGCEAIKT